MKAYPHKQNHFQYILCHKYKYMNQMYLDKSHECYKAAQNIR